jgi:transcriptional regulator with XRE-family HTH domain
MQSIGERLEEARKRKGISIREAAEATKIRSDYLHKFESNQFDIKLPEIYVRGFLRTYANYLKSPADKIIADYSALGLSESKTSRGLNREIYGRMDLSVSSAKAEKDAKDTSPPVETSSPQEPATTRNPATFIPKAAVGLPFDRALLVKAGALLAGIVIVVLILVYFITGRNDKIAATPLAPPNSEVWIHPQSGEPVVTVMAMDRVQLTVQAETGTILYQGTLPRGDRRDIPRRGKLLVNSDAPENLRVNTGGSEWWPLQDKTGAFLKSATINAPAGH